MNSSYHRVENNLVPNSQLEIAGFMSVPACDLTLDGSRRLEEFQERHQF